MIEELSELPARLPELNLSYGLETMIRQKADESGSVTVEALAQCALRLYPESVVQKHIEDLALRFVHRVERLSQARQEQPEKEQGPSDPKRTFGSNLEEWTHTLDPTGICLYLADYDPERAHRMYWWVEADLLELTLKSKLRFESVKHSNAFEAAMYGFGGKYGGDDSTGSGDTIETDLGAGSLAAFGINF